MLLAIVRPVALGLETHLSSPSHENSVRNRHVACIARTAAGGATPRRPPPQPKMNQVSTNTAANLSTRHMQIGLCNWSAVLFVLALSARHFAASGRGSTTPLQLGILTQGLA